MTLNSPDPLRTTLAAAHNILSCRSKGDSATGDRPQAPYRSEGRGLSVILGGILGIMTAETRWRQQHEPQECSLRGMSRSGAGRPTIDSFGRRGFLNLKG